MITGINSYKNILKTVEKNYKIKECCDNLDMLRKAHADGNFTIKEIINAQREYQDWLYNTFNGDVKKIMSLNRSIGLEFEFATYGFKNIQENKQLPVHTVLGKTDGFSSLFNMPFVLETDIYNELEIGFPPFLIANVDGEINKEALYNIWQNLRKTMHEINNEAFGYNLRELTVIFKKYGLGNVWQINLENTGLLISVRKKHKTIKHQVYSQLNISITAKEIAEFISSHKNDAYVSERFEYFSETYQLLYNIIVKNILTNQGKIALVHICKGLANLLAIPSLLLLKDRPESRQNKMGVYSGVKETFGIWVKDSILNIIDYSLTDQPAREEVKKVLIETYPYLDEIMERQVEKAMKIVRVQLGYKEEYKKLALIEYHNTITKIVKRLNYAKPRYIPNKEDVVYKSESFPAQGEGVRRDTFVNIPSPYGIQFHLAEIRNDDHIENFISD